MPGDSDASEGWKDLTVFAVALLALMGFAWFVKYMLGRTTSANELEWTRAIYLLSGVEAIAFAAAGYLFGKEVHRREAENAEKRARESQAQTASAQAVASEAQTKGRALAAAILAKTQGQTARATMYEAFGAQEATRLSQADLEELKVLAENFFPVRSQNPVTS